MVNRVKKRIAKVLAYVLSIMMILSLIPANVRADGTTPTCRLVDTSVTLSTFPVHYIVYKYGNNVSDSRNVSPWTNYNKWRMMSDSDKSKVTKWYAGSYSDMQRQFGGANAESMLNWANEHNGWADAGSRFRARLAEKHYQKLYDYYGDPDKPNQYPPGYYQFINKISGVSTYSEKEKEALNDKIMQYGQAYEDGLRAYQMLIKLKQAQTNAAVTSITSDLLDLIVENMIEPGIMNPGNSLDDLKDAAYDMIDNTFEISDKIKKTNIYKYSVMGLKDSLTGEDKRIDSEEAAKIIALYWKLLNAREDYAEAGYLTCQNMKNDLETETGVLLQNDTTRQNTAQEAKVEREKAYKKALEDDVAYLDAVIPDTSSVKEEDYYETGSNGVSQLNVSQYNRYRQAAAYNWAYTEFIDEYQVYKGQVSEWYEILLKELESCPYSERVKRVDFESSKEYVDDNLIIVDESIEELFWGDYISSKAATEKEFQNKIRANETKIATMKSNRGKYETKMKEAIAELQPKKNYIFTLCHGVSEEYGSWGLGEETWDNVLNRFDDNESSFYSLLYQLDDEIATQEAYLESLKQRYNRYISEKKTFEESLKKVYKLYYDTQLDIDYGMSQIIRFTKLLRDQQASYPAWLKNHPGGSSTEGGDIMGIYTRVDMTDLYKYLTSDTSFGSKDYRTKVATIASKLQGYYDNENYYLEMIFKAREVLKNATTLRMEGPDYFAVYPVLNEQKIKNLNELGLGGLTIKSYDTMSKEFGFEDYENYRLDGKGYVHNTKILNPLIKDLKGENESMDKIRDLYQDLLADRGNLLRKANSGNSQVLNDIKGYIRRATDNYETTSIVRHAQQFSYTSYLVEEYYDENIINTLENIKKVYYKQTGYVEVLSLKKVSKTTPRTSVDPDQVRSSKIEADEDETKETKASAVTENEIIRTNAKEVEPETETTEEKADPVETAVIREEAQTTAEADAPSDNNIEPSIKKGAVKKSLQGNASYKVLAVDNRGITVSLKAVDDKSLETFEIADTVILEDGTIATISSISKNAFKNCRKLKTITIKTDKLKSVGKNAFKGVSKKLKIKVLAKMKKQVGKKLRKAGFKGQIVAVKQIKR